MALMLVVLALAGLGLAMLWRRDARGAAAEPWRQNWRLWIAFVLGGLCVGAGVALLDGRPEDSSIRYALRLLVPRGSVDSWAPMMKAVRFLQEQPGQAIYQVLFFEQHIKFQYPLTSLVPLDLVQRWFHVGTDTLIVALQVLSRACVPLIGLVFAALLAQATQATGAQGQSLSPRAWWGVAAFGVLSAMLFYPIALSETMGQVQTIMTLLAALALWAWQRGAKVLAGVCIGLCCIVKPHWLVIAPWALLRRQWGFTVALVATTGLFSVAAVALYGLHNVLDYASVASYISRRGESYFDNQTVNGLVNRLLFNGDNLQWRGEAFAPFHPAVYALTLASTVALLGLGLLFARKEEPGVLHLAVAMLTLTMASPIAWTHHYGVLFPVFAVMLPWVAACRPWGRWSLPALFVGYVLVSQSFVHATKPLADMRWNVLQSYVLFGAALVLALLLALVRHRGETRQPSGEKPSAEGAAVAAQRSM